MNTGLATANTSTITIIYDLCFPDRVVIVVTEVTVEPPADQGDQLVDLARFVRVNS